jgi:hypothetical protein
MYILLVTLLAIFLTSCSSSPPPQSAPAAAKQRAAPPAIAQFYAQPAVIPKGGKTLLCYGVENATALRLDPPVEKVWPAMSRCFEITPAKTSTYALTAESADGQTTSKSVTVQVGPAAPKIRSVTLSAQEVASGEIVTICYKAENATSVRVTPSDLSGQNSPSTGCVTVKPKATTTYTVTAKGTGGQADTERAVIKVR